MCLYSTSECDAIARQVIEYVTQKPYSPTFVYKLNDEKWSEYQQIKSRLQKYEPLQYILQKAYFFDLEFYVNQSVLIPRPETEEMVEWLINKIKPDACGSYRKLLDIGTGSGCIAITLKKKLPSLEVYAWEISPAAIEVAEHNAIQNQVKVHFLQQDLFQSPIETAFSNFDCVISNPPYIPWQEKAALSKNVVDYEPYLALFVPDNNPLLFYEAIALRAKHVPVPLVTEVHQSYAYEVKKLYLNMGLKNVQIHKDISNHDRWVTANFLS
ncbi:MAG: peptide chain release factor N(5)-glutamine methyltransferase [Bacteroidia bacterium]|nr:peptide chain release factor N(5)-glutamine methyltransferase [Bacteroidia bacterium]